MTAKSGNEQRLSWLRAGLDWDGATWNATPLRAQGSHMLSGLASADALLDIPAGENSLESGSTVSARWLHWFD